MSECLPKAKTDVIEVHISCYFGLVLSTVDSVVIRLLFRLFTVSYFSVRSSRSRAAILIFSLTWGRVSNLLRGRGMVWEEARKIFDIYLSRPPPPRAVIPDARPPRYI